MSRLVQLFAGNLLKVVILAAGDILKDLKMDADSNFLMNTWELVATLD